MWLPSKFFFVFSKQFLQPSIHVIGLVTATNGGPFKINFKEPLVFHPSFTHLPFSTSFNITTYPKWVHHSPSGQLGLFHVKII